MRMMKTLLVLALVCLSLAEAKNKIEAKIEKVCGNKKPLPKECQEYLKSVIPDLPTSALEEKGKDGLQVYKENVIQFPQGAKISTSLGEVWTLHRKLSEGSEGVVFMANAERIFKHLEFGKIEKSPARRAGLVKCVGKGKTSEPLQQQYQREVANYRQLQEQCPTLQGVPQFYGQCDLLSCYMMQHLSGTPIDHLPSSEYPQVQRGTNGNWKKLQLKSGLKVADRVGQILKQVRECGVELNDVQDRNILVRETGDADKDVYVIDLSGHVVPKGGSPSQTKPTKEQQQPLSPPKQKQDKGEQRDDSDSDDDVDEDEDNQEE